MGVPDAAPPCPDNVTWQETPDTATDASCNAFADTENEDNLQPPNHNRPVTTSA